MTKNSPADVISRDKNEHWFYSPEVKEHFFHPKNFLEQEHGYEDAYMGMVGSPACGDAMRVWIRIKKDESGNERITDFKWRTFGCASAIASTSMLSVMATENSGMTIPQALAIKPQDIMVRLGGLPARKVHCSVLGDKALRAAINDYFKKTGQFDRIFIEQGRIIDSVVKATDHDIEEAILEGAITLEQVQAKTKAGVGDPTCLPEVEQLIRFYREKHFGKIDV
ncbi:MAG TPA: iron-sulfur cluster assembly scaffold protein [Patescibacteria group bacterium]|nr:iron-sulfur cluster assembly scaffold protein [Patescibacteria group bacterium]